MLFWSWLKWLLAAKGEMLETYVRLWVLAALSRESQGFSALLDEAATARLRGPFGALLLGRDTTE